MKINKIKYINFNRSHVKIQYVELFEIIICFLEKHLSKIDYITGLTES